MYFLNNQVRLHERQFEVYIYMYCNSWFTFSSATMVKSLFTMNDKTKKSVNEVKTNKQGAGTHTELAPTIFYMYLY